MNANTVECKARHTALAIIALMILTAGASAQKPQGVRVVKNEAMHRVDVFVDGRAFTSYIWPDSLTKPVLYPLFTSQGTIVTRGFPLEPHVLTRRIPSP